MNTIEQIKQSNMFIKVMGPFFEYSPELADTPHFKTTTPNLYLPENMMASWHLINWVMSAPAQVYKVGDKTIGYSFHIWWTDYMYDEGSMKPASEFLEDVIGKIWNLACEAGVFSAE